MVLVGYATRYGSTQEVAEAIAETLREGGLTVDIRPMREVRTLAGHSAVVLGAPLIMSHWHKDALRFLSRHREALMERPVAVFALAQFTIHTMRRSGSLRAPNSIRSWQTIPGLLHIGHSIKKPIDKLRVLL
ncbi:MAG TPA: flavodoxin domain-containing protein [Anaerolineae bacterium]|nr:flavodoxin domain-containing protein [Anaerolineae bacterium]